MMMNNLNDDYQIRSRIIAKLHRDKLEILRLIAQTVHKCIGGCRIGDIKDTTNLCDAMGVMSRLIHADMEIRCAIDRVEGHDERESDAQNSQDPNLNWKCKEHKRVLDPVKICRHPKCFMT